MSKNVVVAIVLIAALAVAVSFLFKEKQNSGGAVINNSPMSSNKPMVLINGGVKFTGVVAEIDTSCEHDGVCRTKVDNKWVITDLGGDPNPEMERARGPKGKIIDENGSVSGTVGIDAVGKVVEVYAKPITETGQPIQKDPPILREGETATVMDPFQFSLYGNPDFYIRFLPFNN
jgi:hypothetical protein